MNNENDERKEIEITGHILTSIIGDSFISISDRGGKPDVNFEYVK